MDVDAYLARIGYGGPRTPTADTLHGLHRAHMLAVPFENLDIHLGRPIPLSRRAFYDKIVTRRRGGFCYELNGLFGWLLTALGFDVTLLSARVYSGDAPGPEFDHLALRVTLEKRWLADVGFGDSFLTPLPFDADGVQVQPSGVFRLGGPPARRVLQRRGAAGWRPAYDFAPTARRLAAFREMCLYQQTSPDSHFTQGTVCSLARADGRVTLANAQLIVTKNGRRVEHAVPDAGAYRAALRDHFGMTLPADAPVARLMRPGGEA